MLKRETEWRQGDLLSSEATASLMPSTRTIEEGSRAVVITHDCDLPNDSETTVELILAEAVEAPNAQFFYAKNPRTLHLRYNVDGGNFVVVALQHAKRVTVTKEEFEKYAVKDVHASLAVAEKRTLKQWLAARYGRPAFPDAFERRLRREIAKKKSVEREIGKILAPASKHLVGLFFDLGEHRTAEIATGEPYGLEISVVYDSTEGGPEARQSAEKIASELHALFECAYGKPDTATEIAIEICEAIADTSLTLADLRRVDQWRLEYISLSEDDHGCFLPVGETPA
ncbi:hypothetical protein [Asaia spathodeae]|uniref:Uncharacterized protein n=1 Tax=Asaia spathodeae TaxID=657016 RepID=A0ABX2P664_9PROT|nr:hypothetical protein [Asaia spathodeae]GBR18800.1 hypothetical protein AA105894_2153 [Asaia spathodeae NBRC 105894]